MNTPKVIPLGTDVFGVVLKGNKEEPEKASFRVHFPGGDVDVIRTTTGDYWIHVRINRPQDGSYIKGDTKTGHIRDARLDIHGKHTADVDAGDFAHPELYHAAFRIEVD